MALTQPINTDVIRLRLGVALDGLTVTVGPGRCFLPNAHRILSDGTVTAVLASPVASTWYYAYAYEASSGILGLELSTTAPSTPYPSATSTARTKAGDTSRRYLGSAYVGASSKLRPMKHSQCGSIGNLVTFGAASSAASIPVNLLSAFVAATATTISLNPLVPATATHALLQVQNNSNRQVYLANPDQGSASATNYVASVNPGASDTMLIEIGSAQQLSVLLSSTGLLGTILGAVLAGSVSISVQGYLFDR
jgi:hypothetical protein